MRPNSSIDPTAAWKKLRFIISVRSDFHMTDSLSIAIHSFALFPKKMNDKISCFSIIIKSWRDKLFANAPGDLGSIPGRVISKTQKMVLDASLLNTQRYKVRIKGKVEQSRERSSALCVVATTPLCSSYRKGKNSGHPRLRSPTLL